MNILQRLKYRIKARRYRYDFKISSGITVTPEMKLSKLIAIYDYCLNRPGFEGIRQELEHELLKGLNEHPK